MDERGGHPSAGPGQAVKGPKGPSDLVFGQMDQGGRGPNPPESPFRKRQVPQISEDEPRRGIPPAGPVQKFR